jgi:hypothetical protein
MLVTYVTTVKCQLSNIHLSNTLGYQTGQACHVGDHVADHVAGQLRTFTFHELAMIDYAFSLISEELCM